MIYDQTILEPSPQNPPGDEPRRILIIDDDRDQAACLSRALSRQGFQTIVAHTLAHGAEALQSSVTHLVILDIRLPDGDGLSFCKALNDGPMSCDTPVIILSGMDGRDIVRRARAAGCQFFLRKPYDPNALLLLVQDTLRSDPLWQEP